MRVSWFRKHDISRKGLLESSNHLGAYLWPSELATQQDVVLFQRSLQLLFAWIRFSKA